MSAESPPPGDDADEISVVIKALRAADLRLEELTAGEVDTVFDREGHSFLLQRAQDQMRATEATKQAAILNALPACIAVLDSEGRVLSVNDMWGLLTAGNPLHGPAYGVGNNYLDMCDQAARPGLRRRTPRGRRHSIRAGRRDREFFHGISLRPASRAALVPVDHHTVVPQSTERCGRHARGHHQSKTR